MLFEIATLKQNDRTVFLNIFLLHKEQIMEKGTGIAFGIAIGAAVGVAIGSLGLWIAIGIVVGVLYENGEFDEWMDKWECKTEE